MSVWGRENGWRFAVKGADVVRILIAEDDDAVRGFLEMALQKAGYEAVSVPDGATALRIAQEHAYDLLLADIVMPGMDGIALSREIKKVSPETQIMFITGFAAVAMNEARASGVGEMILAKPFHLRDLVSRVEQLLGKSPSCQPV